MQICKTNRKTKEQSYKEFTAKRNKSLQKKFSQIPTNQTLIFVPHCMRKTSLCKALEKEGYFLCANCGACKIAHINQLAKELGYKALFILKGGSTINKIIKEQAPKAIVGISCFFEGAQAFKLLKDYDIAVQFVPLIKDGCADTDTDLNEVEKILRSPRG
jgi:hypothetical protein